MFPLLIIFPRVPLLARYSLHFPCSLFSQGFHPRVRLLRHRNADVSAEHPSTYVLLHSSLVTGLKIASIFNCFEFSLKGSLLLFFWAKGLINGECFVSRWFTNACAYYGIAMLTSALNTPARMCCSTPAGGSLTLAPTTASQCWQQSSTCPQTLTSLSPPHLPCLTSSHPPSPPSLLPKWDTSPS